MRAAKWFEWPVWKVALWIETGEGCYIGFEYHRGWLVLKFCFLGLTIGRSSDS
jgi:hypothetical protein